MNDPGPQRGNRERKGVKMETLNNYLEESSLEIETLKRITGIKDIGGCEVRELICRMDQCIVSELIIPGHCIRFFLTSDPGDPGVWTDEIGENSFIGIYLDFECSGGEARKLGIPVQRIRDRELYAHYSNVGCRV